MTFTDKHNNTHKTKCRRNYFVLISGCLYNVYEDWTTTKSHFSPLMSSLLAPLHAISFFISSPFLSNLMNLDTNIFFKRGAS